MKVQEVILKAMAGSLKWWEAAEIIGISDRSLRRWRERYEKFGYDGLFDRRKKRPSPQRVPVKMVEQVLELYREKYFDFNVRHFHEKLVEEHGIKLSYTWVKKALQEAGLVCGAIQRSRSPLLPHAAGWGQGGSEQRDAARAGAQGTGDPDDPGVFATRPRTSGTQLSDMARATAAGAASARNLGRGRRQ